MKREELAEWIAHPVYSPRVKRYGVSMEDALRFVDEYAHELAEMQRVQANTYAMMRSETMRLKALGAREVADLIDPEITGP
ncbi:hypothetical protein ACIOHE_26315 [Streptomyces sp. NPDC087851]|uniref:hypothetical protein n=1 Tax=Streptomyces sp. NPDC087851 TaxID=3365810 RepID=UPI00381B0D54